MSAFIVSNYDITAIVEGFKRYNIHLMYNYHPRTDFQRVGQLLREQNYRSVVACHQNNMEIPKFTPKYKETENGKRVDYTLGEIYGTVSCFEYQACESKGWFESPMHFALAQLKDSIAEEVLKANGDEVPWGIDLSSKCPVDSYK